MIKAKLSKLERAAASIGAAQCRHCGGRSGVGGVPLVVICGKPGYGTYAPGGAPGVAGRRRMSSIW
jgi:hypothetical protein